MTAIQFAGRVKTRDGAIAAAAILGTVLGLLLILPIASAFRSQDRELSKALYRLGVLRARAQLAPAAEGQLAEMRRRMDALPGSLRPATTALAQSQLQQTMESIAGERGATIRSTQILPSQGRHGFETIAIQYDLAAPMSKLQGLLYAIEGHVPYLFIDNVQIGAGQIQQSAAAANQDPMLDLRWTVRAYHWSRSR